MDCPDCESPTVVFAAGEYADTLPGDGGYDEAAGVALCTRCLTLHPATEQPGDAPDFQRVSSAFPTSPAAAVPLALLVGLLGSLALYRAEITDLFGAAERAGTDPLLALDRLAADESVEAAVDLSGRRRQLEQLL
jgi:hypothetical protein